MELTTPYEDKCDSYFNQYPTKIRISSTTETEPMIVGSKSYKNYPFIRQKDIGANTSNRFIDTLNISNLYLDGIGGKPSIIASDVNKNLFNCWKAKLERAC